ncbi:hypothetical protein K4K60_006387 [Colletotrichum sp. SAR11_57]|nr:hypothetical protein K4K60_006387 [Colletotrichum sp. SAR11_57]
MVESWAAVRPYLPPVNFITVHYAYFILVGLIFAGIFHGISNPANSVSFIDSLFLVISAFTTSGLNTVDISKLSTAQQAIIALMMILGSPVFVSIFTIWLRARVFEKRFEDIVEAERNRRIKKTGTIVGMAGAMIGLPVMSSFKGTKRKQKKGRHERQAEADAFQLTGYKSREKGHDRSQSQPANQESAPSGMLEPIEEGQRLNLSTSSTEPLSPKSNATPRRRPFSRDSGRVSISEGFDFKTFIHENKTSIGRNGQFFDLTEEQREYLGGVEYRALKILFTIVCVYFVLWQLLGAITLGAWSYTHSQSITAVNSQNSWWAGIFLAISSFNNAGMTLLDAGIAAFDNDAFVLTIVTILSLAGNAAFPAFLRATVYFCRFVLKMCVDEDEHVVWKEAFDFILKYPRRLYMMMFPAKANFVFVTMFSTIAVMDWVLLVVLSIGNSAIEAYPVGKRVGLALFQALAIPSSGFGVVGVSSLYFDVLVLWVIVMYISAYPEIIVMRNSNVYEERSLGIYTTEPEKPEDPDATANESTDELLPTFAEPAFGHALGPEQTAVSASGVSLSQVKSHFSTKPVKRIAAIGRRGTSFVGKQIQSRMNNFQGVGVTAKPRLKRSAAINFDNPNAGSASTPEGHVSLVSQHLRGQLSHDIWAIAFSLFLVTLIETSHSIADPRSYSVFNFLFEIVSGYTNIGLSIGLPGHSFSFAGGWYTGSKLVMILMMIRGRHRGLPVALDHSVKLPGWDNVKKQNEDAEIRRTLWQRAYDKLERDNPDLVKQFKTLFIHIAEPTNSNGNNEIEGNRETLSEEAVRCAIAKGLERIEEYDAVMEAAGEVVDIILGCKDLISVALTAVPQVAAVWTGMTLVLQGFSNAAAQSVVNRGGILYVASLVHWYCQLFVVWANNGQDQSENLLVQLRGQFVELYSKTIEYQMRSVVLYYRNRFIRALRGAMRIDAWEATLERIRQDEKELYRRLQPYHEQRATFHLKDIRKGMNDMLNLMESSQTWKISKMIGSFNLEGLEYERFKNENPDEEQNTCDWFLEMNDVRSWDKGLLLLTAVPGQGKSVLARFLAKRWAKEGTVCHFFFKDDSRVRKKSSNAFCALLHQLLMQHPYVASIKETEQLQEKVKIELKGDCSQHTFIWLRLIFSVLKSHRTQTLSDDQWLALIKSASDIDATYEKLLASVDAVVVDDVKLLFSLIMAAAEPLTVAEVNAALHICKGKDPGGVYMSNDKLMKKWINDNTAFLTTISAETDGRVQFIHQTAREFLRKLESPEKEVTGAHVDVGGSSSVSPSTFKRFTTEKQAHIAMLDACENSLLYQTRQWKDEKNRRSRNDQKDAGRLHIKDFALDTYHQRGFLDYALRFYAFHFDKLFLSFEIPNDMPLGPMRDKDEPFAGLIEHPLFFEGTSATTGRTFLSVEDLEIFINELTLSE